MISFSVAPGIRAPRRFAVLLALLLLPFALCSHAAAQLLNGRFITSAYTWQKFDTVNVSKTIIRAYQSAIFDVQQGDFALFTHVQVAPVLQQGLGDAPDYRMLYLYGRWKNIAEAVDLSVGRMPYFVGVGSGTVDGALTTVRLLEKKVRVTAYGGANVPLDLAVQNWGPLKNNFTLGGQILTTMVDRLRLGVSYTNRVLARPSYWTLRPDSLFNPVPQFIEPEPLKEQLASGDASYTATGMTVYGRYDYDVIENKTQRGQLGVSYYGWENVAVRVDYIHRAPRVLYNSFFSVFKASDVDEVNAGVDYTVAPTARVFARGGYVKYVDDKSLRYTLGIAHTYGALTVSGGSGYAGELNSVSLQAAYPFCDNQLVPEAGVSYFSYKLTDATTQNAFAGVLGATVRPIKTFSADLQGQWLSNKIYKSDFRLFVKLNYWFAERLNLFE